MPSSVPFSGRVAGAMRWWIVKMREWLVDTRWWIVDMRRWIVDTRWWIVYMREPAFAAIGIG